MAAIPEVTAVQLSITAYSAKALSNSATRFPSAIVREEMTSATASFSSLPMLSLAIGATFLPCHLISTLFIQINHFMEGCSSLFVL